jgi:hypothetical protein
MDDSSRLSYLVVMAMITNDVNGLDHVHVLQACANTKLGSYLLLVLPRCLASPTGAEFFYCIHCTTSFFAPADKTDSAARTRTQDTTPFSILFGKVCVGRR